MITLMTSGKSQVVLYVLLSLTISLTVALWLWFSTPIMKLASSSQETDTFLTISSNPNLDYYAEKAPTRIRMFVTYHNAIGEQVIRQFSRNYTRKWVVPVLCNATKYFEYYSYKKLSQLSMEGDLKDVDYVIMTGYKTITKEAFAGQMVGGGVFLTEDLELQTLLEYAREYPEYDFIPFFINHRGRSVARGLPFSHGVKAVKALTSTLKVMNWTNDEIQTSLSTFEFYRNTFMVRTAVFLELAKEMTLFIDTIEADPNIEKLYKHNAGYGAAKLDVALKTFGTPYYQMHCFVAERMPTVFLNHLKAKTPIALLPEIMKLAKRNTKKSKKKNNLLSYWTNGQSTDPFLKCLHSFPLLDKLVRKNTTRMKVFVTYHDGVGERAIRYFSCGYSRKWIVPLFYNRTKDLEYSVYKDLDKLDLSHELKDIDYVMMTNFKLVAPHEWGLRYDQHIDTSLDEHKLFTVIEFAADHSKYDVVPVYPSNKHSKTMQDSQSVSVLRTVLQAANMTEVGDISHSGRSHEILRNTYLAKTESFIRLTRTMASTIGAIETHLVRTSTEASLASQVSNTVMETVLSIAASRITSNISTKRFEKLGLNSIS